jgi:hypothetical protein
MNHQQCEGCLNPLKLLCRCWLGKLFYQLYGKRKYHPTLRHEEAANPDGARLR